MIRIIFVYSLFALLLMPALSHSASSSGIAAAPDKPRWTLEMNLGFFEPEDENWSTFYGGSTMPQVGISAAYRLFSVLDIGANIDISQDQGTGYLPISDIPSGSVTYRAVPIDVFAVLRLRFSERQWFIPYGGGGYTRFMYHQSVSGQGTTRGGLNGYHVRVGIQLLLDNLDKEAAKTMYSSYGAINTYLYFEAKRTKAEEDAADGSSVIQLGGDSFKMGIMVEFK